MLSELDVLKIVCERLDRARLPYMLTGSYALAYYATPRMTRDLDIVIELNESDDTLIESTFGADFYVDASEIPIAVRTERMFNLMHLASGVKVDFIVRKGSEYRLLEFARRQQVSLGGVPLSIVSREDLILSKLVWASQFGSELQRRDARSLLNASVDRRYLEEWAARLGVAALLTEIDE